MVGITLVASLLFAWSDAAAGQQTVSGLSPVVATDVTGLTSLNGNVSVASVQAAAGAGVTVNALQETEDGLPRGYVLIKPVTQTTPLPLLVVLHGVNASPTQEILRDEFLPLAEAGKAILLYPAAYGEAWNLDAQGCCGPSEGHGLSDIEFIRQLLVTTTASLSISQSDLVGFSNGGKLAYQVMCEEPQLFGALAVVAAVPPATCTSAVQRSVLVAVGANDTSLESKKIAGPSVGLLTSTLAGFRARDACPTVVVRSNVENASSSEWSCADGTDVEGVSYAGVAHDWPNAASVGAADSAATVIWSFFSKSK